MRDVSLAHVDSWIKFILLDVIAKGKEEENREEFIETAITWIRAIHGFSEDTLNSIADSFLKNENPDIFSVKVGYNKYKYIAYENRPSVWDRYKDATYWIFCYEDY